MIRTDYLDKKSIEYFRQHTFDKCKYKNPLPFDFYLPKYNACVEYDGEQHFMPLSVFGGEKAFNELKRRDSTKDKYCKDNNITLIRIKYDQNIEEILKEHFEL